MTDARLQTLIDNAFEDRARINPQTTGDVRDAVEAALNLLDAGKARVAEKISGATGPNPVHRTPDAVNREGVPAGHGERRAGAVTWSGRLRIA